MRAIILFASLFFVLRIFAEESTVRQMDQKRAELIVRAFNDKPENLVEPLTLESIKIVDGVGRIDVNKKAKLSYYIQTEAAADPQSRIFVIPMATSRFTPTYYQTDEWWDAHKNEKPMPRQPMEEVAAWLKEMKLTSNPDVLIFAPGTLDVSRIPLQKFLLQAYVERYAKNGMITLYRGAERENETEAWESKQRPKGVRYWTPTANYAWRYARKNLSFIEDLVRGQAPLLKFQVPVSDFQSMVSRKWPRLTLGTELTKHAHESFDHYGKFQDHIAGGADFLGEGVFGVEFEVRSNRSGADQMAAYYKGTISIEELAEDRIRVIQEATKRLQAQRPQENEELRRAAAQRLQTINNEAELLHLLKNKGSSQRIRELLGKLEGRSEITKVDGFSLKSFVEKKLAEGGFDQKVTPLRKSCRAIY